MNYNINMIKTRGFTLIELMITLAVVSIVLLTCLPSLTNMTDSNRLVSQINSLSGSLALARSEAIKSGKVVTICASSNTTSCNVTTWHSGWIAFTDIDKDTVVDGGGVDTIIQIQGALNGGPTLKLTLSDNAGTYQFLPDGSSRDSNSSGATIGTFVLCPKDNDVKKAKALNVNFIGRSSPAQRATPTSPIFDAAGSAVTCP